MKNKYFDKESVLVFLLVLTGLLIGIALFSGMYILANVIGGSI